MDPIFTKDVLRSLGIAGKAVALAIVVGAGFFIYKTILDTKLTKLQISQLEKELGEK